MAAIARSGGQLAYLLFTVAQGSGEGYPSPYLPSHSILEHSSVLKCYLNLGNLGPRGAGV